MSSPARKPIDIHRLASKYQLFSASEISAFHQQFAHFDREGRDSVHQRDLATVATKSGENLQDVVDKLNNLRLSTERGYVSFEGFLTAVSKIKQEKGVSITQGSEKTKITLHGHSENTTHTINEDEKESFVLHINSQLDNDPVLGKRIPIDPFAMQNPKISVFQATENNNGTPSFLSLIPFTGNILVVLNSAKAIGCSVVNIGAQDMQEGKEHLVLGLIWQIIKIGLSSKVDIKVHPELFRLLNPGETLEEFLKLPTDQILMRWFNFHLKAAGWGRRVNNFSSDVKDGENYTVLLNQLKPTICSRDPLQERDLHQRAEKVLQNADRIGCRKYLNAYIPSLPLLPNTLPHTLRKTMVAGNTKLNFAFVANLFNTHPGLEPLSQADKETLDESMFDSAGDREARAFALWLNSLGVDPFVNNLFDDLGDGLVLLQAMDIVQPGIVDWKKVNKAPVKSKFKKVENTNYVVLLGKSMRFSLVGIGGSDITDGIKNLTLALVWQLMREHVIQTLKVLSKDGKEINDADLIRWANSSTQRSGKRSQMKSMQDPGLRNGIFFCDLLDALSPGIVDYSLVTNGVSEENAKLNAMYAISIARKLGATIFVLPEDIIEVKPKMILTFIDATEIGTSLSPTGSKPELIRLQLIPWSTVPMVKPILNELVERRVKDGQKFKVGRQVTKEIPPGQPIPALEDPNPLDVWLLSKVVSRQHAEFSIQDGQIYLRDVGSSSGTFLNKMRLSPTTKESKPFPVKEGDIIQFGVDYKGRPDDVYKSITVRIGFYDQSWVHKQRKKANPTKYKYSFRKAMISLLNSTNSTPETQRENDEVPECCICYEETGPFQALFLAPCSHCYHYKCVMSIIVQSAMFQCPLCRQVANLTASVSTENINEIQDLPQEEEEVAIGAKGDPKKFLQAAQMIQNARAAAEVAAATAAASKKKKGRANSFTTRITTMFRRPSSNGGSSPHNQAGSIPVSPLRNNVPDNQHVESPTDESGAEEQVAANDARQTDEVVQESSGGEYALASREPNIGGDYIPRSATANTFEDVDDEHLVAPVDIPSTIRESVRELPGI
ncbi:MAG: hypothetical protein SGCHY_001301 [Lobulomycetales sp.]